MKYDGKKKKEKKKKENINLKVMKVNHKAN